MTSAFALTSLLPLPLLIGMGGALAGGFRVLAKGKIMLRLKYEDLLLFAFLMQLLMSSLFSVGDVNNRHIVAYFAVIAIYYYGTLLMLPQLSEQNLARFMAAGLLLACLFSIAEFLSKNFVDLYILDSIIPRPDVQHLNPLFMGTWFRARSFVVEPGHLALYINLIGPWAISGFSRWCRHKWLTNLFIMLVGAAFVFTFSVAGLVAGMVGLFVCILTLRISGKQLGFILLLLVLLIAGTTVQDAAVISTAAEGLLYKIDPTNLPFITRAIRWQSAWEMFFQKPLMGWGPGSSGGAISWYLQVLAETGIVGFSILIVFLLVSCWRIIRLPRFPGRVLLYSITAGLVHYALIGDFWYPWLWFVLAYARHFSKRTLYNKAM